MIIIDRYVILSRAQFIIDIKAEVYKSAAVSHYCKTAQWRIPIYLLPSCFHSMQLPPYFGIYSHRYFSQPAVIIEACDGYT